MAKKQQPSAALQYLDASFFEHSPKHRAALEETRACQEIGRAVYDLRVRSGLSARELARAAGLTPRALEKLESGAGARHALAQLRQVAAALGKRVELRVLAGKPKARAARRALDGATAATPTAPGPAKKSVRRRAKLALPPSPATPGYVPADLRGHEPRVL